MRYLLLIYGDEKAQEQAMQGLSEEQQETEMKVWFEYTDWLREKGFHEAGEGLEPTAAATTVRAPGRRRRRHRWAVRGDQGTARRLLPDQDREPG